MRPGFNYEVNLCVSSYIPLWILSRIFDFSVWQEDDEPLEDDELPEWKRPRPQLDLSKLDPNNPESMLKMSKLGQTLMMFATVSGKLLSSSIMCDYNVWYTVETVLRNHCHEGLPVLKDQIFLAEGPTF